AAAGADQNRDQRRDCDRSSRRSEGKRPRGDGRAQLSDGRAIACDESLWRVKAISVIIMEGKFGFSLADCCSRICVRSVTHVFQTLQRSASQSEPITTFARK